MDVEDEQAVRKEIEREQLREWYHEQGIPVGVGIDPPGGHISSQELAEELDFEKHAILKDEEIGENIAFNDATNYAARQPSGDKARIVQFVNTNDPWNIKKVETPDGRSMNVIDGGEIPPFQYFKHWGWFAHNSSLSNLDEQQIRVHEIELDINQMEIRFGMLRHQYDAQMNADMRNAKHLGVLRLNQNKDGMERYLSAAEILDDVKAYNIVRGKREGSLNRIGNRLRRGPE